MTDIPKSQMAPRSGIQINRRTLIKTAAGILLIPVMVGELHPAPAPLLHISNKYSHLNRKRPQRQSTRYIILHTTEGAETGALQKIRQYGEANYLVTRSGVVYRIIDKKRIARHCGRSMWNGQTTIDDSSIGIEVVGYHNKDIRDAQYVALRELLRQLQSLFDIPDNHVLTHSMVAYGNPNRFHNYKHRGRKSCGRIFALPEVRARLGLETRPAYDPDVKSGRLKVGDKKLFNILFPPVSEPVLAASGNDTKHLQSSRMESPQESFTISSSNSAWDIARELYNRPSTIYTFPNGSSKSGDQIVNWARIPVGTRVALNAMEDTQPFEGFLEIGKDGDSAIAVAGNDYTSATTIYLFPDGYIRTGSELQKKGSGRSLLKNTPKKTLVLIGYIYGGYVKANRPATSIAGRKWNYPSTYYRHPDGTILSGDDIDQKNIPPKTLIFYQQ